ncbi:ATP-dependent nuclease [Pseudoalteromonas lipolytica]|uniref:ATP-dependent nuclease n=1 Tax=Pseudoalteromonas lipolytica TaxID=570156 RepID=UPI0030A21558
MIRLINITHFRSIRKLNLTTEEITTFVGKNDAGKSNILRALNLFFNGKTDSHKNFNFNADFNIHAKTYKQRAKEVTVELVFKLPPSYRRKEFPNTVCWKKIWRESGLHKEEMSYCELKNKRITKKLNFPARSKISFLLKNINFTYIPAIKDKEFFKELQGQLYDVLANSSDAGLHSSANSFEQEINNHVEELMQDINGTLKGINEIRLPKNLRDIFGALEFNSNEIPLDRRGDGIKIRHIPMMLSFIAHKQRTYGQRTALKPQIWAFEEPENNVEFLTCFELNKQLVKAAQQHTQIFITTHSPAIYSISNDVVNGCDLKTVKYYVDKVDDDTSVIDTDDEQLHGNVGFIKLITPVIEAHKVDWHRKEKEYKSLIEEMKTKQDENDSATRIFVEGKSDKVVLDRILKFKGFSCLIDAPDNAHNSANAASDRALAFDLVQKHSKVALKGLLLLDKDDAGKAAKNSFSDRKSQKSNVKCMYFEPTDFLKELFPQGFNVSIDLENLYPEAIWNLALNNGWLEKVECEASKFTENKRFEMFNNNTTPRELIETLSPLQKLIVEYKFKIEGKIEASNYIKSLNDQELREYGLIKAFEPTLNKVIKFLQV